MAGSIRCHIRRWLHASAKDKRDVEASSKFQVEETQATQYSRYSEDKLRQQCCSQTLPVAGRNNSSSCVERQRLLAQ